MVVERALAAEGRVDVLVCNAGAGWAGPIGELRAAKASELLSLNLLAPIARAVSRDLDVVYVPGWLRFPAWLHGVAPRTFRRMAIRFG